MNVSSVSLLENRFCSRVCKIVARQGNLGLVAWPSQCWSQRVLFKSILFCFVFLKCIFKSLFWEIEFSGVTWPMLTGGKRTSQRIFFKSVFLNCISKSVLEEIGFSGVTWLILTGGQEHKSKGIFCKCTFLMCIF